MKHHRHQVKKYEGDASLFTGDVQVVAFVQATICWTKANDHF